MSICKFGSCVRSTVAAVAAMLSLTLFANANFDWKGTGGGVTVPAGGAAITDDDITDVQNLTSIVLADSTAAVTASGLTSTLALSAAVSGPGTLSFTSCAGITLSGDNSALTGSFSFNDTPVTVTSRHGLGGANTPYVTFTKGSNGTSTFSGNGLTNDVPIRISGEFVLQGGSDEEFVQRGDITTLDNGVDFWCKNVYHESGALGNGRYTFSMRPLKGYRLRLGSGVTVGSKSTIVNLIGQYTAKQPAHYFRLEGAAFANSGDLQFWNYSVGLELGVANAWPIDRNMVVMIGSPGDGGIDLCGFNQSVPAIKTAQYTPSEGGSNVRLTIRSTAAATLSLTDTNANAVKIPFKFSGAASFHYAGNGSYTLIHHLSDTTGDLTVSSGTVTFDWGAGWGGTNVTIGANGTLAITEDSSGIGLYTENGQRRNTLVVEKGGTLNLAKNVCVTSYWAKANGKWLHRGTYGDPMRGLSPRKRSLRLAARVGCAFVDLSMLD